MFRKKLFGSVASLLMIFSVTSSIAFAQDTTISKGDEKYQENAKKLVEQFVGQAYKPYYKINKIDSKISDYSVKDNVVTARVNISLSKMLKAKSVDEIPYVKGMKNKSKALKLSKDKNADDSEEVVAKKIKELSEYIGTETQQNDSFRVTANIVNGTLDTDHATLEFLNYKDWIPATYFIPETEEKMIENGEKDLTATITTNRAFAVKSAVQPLASFTYDRIAARNYANKYTSEHNGGYDTSYWNPDYAWHTESGGVDCANYVSQAMYAGGIPTDSTWKKESIAWLNTGRFRSDGLEDYMVGNKQYFYKTTRYDTSAGGFISAIKYSHVMFVVANDGITMQYSAHTDDRLKASFANFSSTDFEFFYVNSAYLP